MRRGRVAARARLQGQPRHRPPPRASRASSSAATGGRSGARRSTTRSTASSSRSTSGRCGASSAWSAASRAGRSPGSSRRRRRRRRCSSVVWNVGRTGHLVPFAMLEPVHVGGVTVTTATLHNEEDLARKDVRDGDEVVVMRAGDVIPQVVSPKLPRKNKSARKPKPPKKCPACGTPTVKPEGAVFTICPNRAGCPGQSFQHVKHFVSKGAMDIDGLGEKQALRFLEEGLIADVADIYDLSEEQLVGARSGFGEISARNLLAAIDASRAAPLQARPLRARPARRRLRHRRGAGRPLRLDRRPARGRPRADRGGRGGRADHGRADRRVARRRADLGAGREAAREGAAPGGRRVRTARQRRPAGGQDRRPHRHPAGADPRGGGGAGQGGRRQGGQLGLEENRLRRRRREPRARSWPRPRHWGPRCSTKRAAGAARSRQ